MMNEKQYFSHFLANLMAIIKFSIPMNFKKNLKKQCLSVAIVKNEQLICGSSSHF